jgi:uncharacterized protein involved in outer membrane biogenesis
MKLFKFLFRLVLALVLLVVILVIVFLLSYNSILRAIMEHQIRAQTGMDAEIGRLNLALMAPTLEIQNFKIHNPPDFGGTPFLDIPEIHVEYDRPALARGEIHITLLRFNLGELDIVKNQAGRTNIFSLGVPLPTKKSTGSSTTTLADFKKQTGLDFKGIDVLNVSIGKLKYIDLQKPQNNREQTIGIENCLMKNVKSPADLAGLGALIALRSGDFFGALVGQQQSGLNLLKQLGQ